MPVIDELLIERRADRVLQPHHVIFDRLPLKSADTLI